MKYNYGINVDIDLSDWNEAEGFEAHFTILENKHKLHDAPSKDNHTNDEIQEFTKFQSEEELLNYFDEYVAVEERLNNVPNMQAFGRALRVEAVKYIYNENNEIMEVILKEWEA